MYKVLGLKFMDTINHQLTMPRAPRVSIMARQEFTPEKQTQIIGAYRRGAPVHDVVAY